MTPETVQSYVDEIKARVASWRNGELVDPPLQSELLTYTLNEIGALAINGHKLTGEHPADPQTWAALILVALHRRASGGTPFGEPIEPSWSLDPDERPYEYTLSDGDGDLG